MRRPALPLDASLEVFAQAMLTPWKGLPPRPLSSGQRFATPDFEPQATAAMAPKTAKPAPTHPKYVVMITDAIKTLKERTGSSAPAIAKVRALRKPLLRRLSLSFTSTEPLPRRPVALVAERAHCNGLPGGEGGAGSTCNSCLRPVPEWFRSVALLLLSVLSCWFFRAGQTSHWFARLMTHRAQRQLEHRLPRGSWPHSAKCAKPCMACSTMRRREQQHARSAPPLRSGSCP